MESGDGLLLRVRPRAGALSARDLTRIAGVAQRFGNGLVDLTQRANLQLRGLRPETLAPAQADLASAGLLDAHEGIEAVRNILVSPLAGIDETAAFDARAVAAAIEAGLAADETLQTLPPKFFFLIDDGGRLPLGAVSADIRVRATAGGTLLSVGGTHGDAAFVALMPSDPAEAALALARAFLRLRERYPVRRMREAVERFGVARLAHEAGFSSNTEADAPPRGEPRTADLYGAQDGYHGVGAPFGSLTAATLAGIAALAPNGVRLTPWRAILLPGFAPAAAAGLATLDLILDAADPRLRVAACPGAPACSSGETPARAVAARLAAVLPAQTPAGITLHVSGCAKGCAHRPAAPFTAIGREGRYDLVLDGRTGDAPTLRGLDLSALGEALGPRRARALAS